MAESPLTEGPATGLSAGEMTEILDVLARWGINEDTADAEAWAGLFTPDGHFLNSRGVDVAGHDALVQAARERAAKPGVAERTHWMSAPRIVRDGDDVEVRHYGMVVEPDPANPGTFRVRSSSERIYRFRRTEDGAWLIADRAIRPYTAG